MLLHDDDLLVAGGLDRLAAAWESHRNVAAVFGKFHIVFESGEIDAAGSERYNRDYYRTPDLAGPQASAVVSGLRQQFTGAGYLVDRALACSVGFRTPSVVGEFLDMDFGVRLGLAAEPARFVFIDHHVYKYRQTRDSIARSREIVEKRQHLLYDALSELVIPEQYEDERLQAQRRLSPYCVLSYAVSGKRGRALRLLFSKEYGLPRSSPRALYHLLGILLPRAVVWRERWRRRRRSQPGIPGA
jgi:hypothetical protein